MLLNAKKNLNIVNYYVWDQNSKHSNCCWTIKIWHKQTKYFFPVSTEVHKNNHHFNTIWYTWGAENVLVITQCKLLLSSSFVFFRIISKLLKQTQHSKKCSFFHFYLFRAWYSNIAFSLLKLCLTSKGNTNTSTLTSLSNGSSGLWTTLKG